MTTTDALIETLTAHALSGRGLSWNSADTCTCGVRTTPEPGDEDVSVRRFRAHAVHVAQELHAAGLVR